MRNGDTGNRAPSGWRGAAKGMGVAALLLAAVGLAPGDARAATAPVARFDWRMPDRYGLDPDGDGLWDVNLTPSFLFPPSWQVRLDGCASTGGDTAINAYHWHIVGPGLAMPLDTTATGCATDVSLPQQGGYMVTLNVQTAGGQTAEHSAQVTVRDLLLVSMGDSYASGEGNPDVPTFMSSTGKAVWANQQCHRTRWAGPSLAALGLEQADPHTSVTFIDLSCSGATVPAGVAGPYAGAEQGAQLPPQIDQLAALMTAAGRPRTIDALSLSIGGNDLGFVDIVETCGTTPQCYQDNPSLPNAQEAWSIYQTGLASLPAHYATLSAALNAKLGAVLPAGHVYLREYPDLLRDSTGNPCNNLLDGVTLDEVQWAVNTVAPALNAAVRTAATANGWQVQAVPPGFRTHGYCAADNWIEQLLWSIVWQGDYRGTLHPTLTGQVAYALSLYFTLQPTLAPTLSATATPRVFSDALERAQWLQTAAATAMEEPTEGQ